MKNIVLLYNTRMSVNMVVVKMEKIATDNGYHCFAFANYENKNTIRSDHAVFDFAKKVIG